MKLPLGIGPYVLVSRAWVTELEQKLGSIKSNGGKLIKENEQLEAVVRRQHDLLVAVEAERDLAVARYRETNEALGELLAELERYRSILRHPVTQPRPEDTA